MLIKAAYTGVAASLIDGKTTHTIGMISQAQRTLSNEAKMKLSQFWLPYKYLILDECSMLAKSFLMVLSRNISIAKQGSATTEYSFGGVNVVLCGDFHQFPPVAQPAYEALYCPTGPATQSNDEHAINSGIGHAIYDEFTQVIILKEQVNNSAFP